MPAAETIVVAGSKAIAPKAARRSKPIAGINQNLLLKRPSLIVVLLLKGIRKTDF